MSGSVFKAVSTCVFRDVGGSTNDVVSCMQPGALHVGPVKMVLKVSSYLGSHWLIGLLKAERDSFLFIHLALS